MAATHSPVARGIRAEGTSRASLTERGARVLGRRSVHPPTMQKRQEAFSFFVGRCNRSRGFETFQNVIAGDARPSPRSLRPSGVAYGRSRFP